MPANHQDFFGMFPSANLADDVSSLHGAIRKCVLHVEANPRRDAALKKTFQLPVVLSSHRQDRNGEICVEAEDPRVRQVHT